MKIRQDFVTNSSSSSFIIAKKGEFNSEQKEKLFECYLNRIMGDCCLSPDASEEQISDFMEKHGYCFDEEEVRTALSNGMTVYGGRISLYDDDPIYDLLSVYRNAWKLLEKSGDGNFKIIEEQTY